LLTAPRDSEQREPLLGQSSQDEARQSTPHPVWKDSRKPEVDRSDD
ncbi:hypothetical protein AVEN_22338-1, partial [Araneus ventricosus]